MLPTEPSVKPTKTDWLTPPDSAVTVATPAVLAEINETATTPVVSLVVAVMVVTPPEKVPKLVMNVTWVPTGTGLPARFFTVAVIVLELLPSAGMLVGFATSVMLPTEPSVKPTRMDWITPPDVAVTVATPAVLAEINETETTPVASGVVTVTLVPPPLNVPRSVVKVTLVPGWTGALALSLKVAVMVEELLPSAGILVGSAASVMLTTAPPVKVTFTDCVIPPDVALTMAVPAVVDEISDTETTPVPSRVVTEMLVPPPEKIPSVVLNVTVVPAGTGFPKVSFTVAVIVLELLPSAGMLVGFATSVMLPTVPSVKPTRTDWITPPDVAVTVATPARGGRDQRHRNHTGAIIDGGGEGGDAA